MGGLAAQLLGFNIGKCQKKPKTPQTAIRSWEQMPEIEAQLWMSQYFFQIDE